MIFKLGLKEIKQNIIINILCLLQIIIIFVTICAMLSSVFSRLEKYTPFREELNKKGDFFCAEQFYFYDQHSGYVVRNEDDIKDKFNLIKVEDIMCIKEVWVQEDIVVRGYNSDLIKKYKPILESGNWLSGMNNLPDDIIEGVISENFDNIETGDVIEISEAFSGEKIKVYIVGKFNESTSIIGFNSSSNGKYSYENLYENYNCQYWGRPMLLVNIDELSIKNSNFKTQVKSSMIINYQDDISNAEREQNFRSLTSGNFMPGYSDLEEMNNNSKKILLEELLRLLPIIISTFVLTMLSILSVSAINAKTRMKTYAVYYICGMKWYHVVTIEVIKSSIIVLLAGIISLIFCNIEKNKILFGKLLIDTGLKQMICCFITGLIFIAASAIIPRIMIGREKPVTTFHRN